ncbi:non-ribosomal peptide synthetase, partial [Kordiimonas aquimaris]|uniref:non-ribosomal peptide synthetase n=1 Tax=Kordiimonas aquimaris TaxID=707591 RepID=UPI0021D09C66
LPLLSSLERDRLLIEWNDTSAAYASDKCLHTLFEEQASRTPDNIAVVYEGSELSYAELNKRSNQLAHYLIEQGVKPDSLVGLCLDRSLEMVVGIMGILKAGGAYVPLDPDYPEDRLRFMLDDTQAHIVIGQASIATDLSLFDERCQDRPELVLLDEPEQLEALSFYPETNPDTSALGICSDHLAYVIYTSGSTGKPKGVCVEHKSVGRLLNTCQEKFKFNSKDVWTFFHSCSFDFSVWELWGALFCGGKALLLSDDVRRSTDLLLKVFIDYQVTIFSQTPSGFYRLMSRCIIQKATLDSLRYVVFGGEALEPNKLKPWFRFYRGLNARMINMYGLTEATVHATFHEVTRKEAEQTCSVIGRPLADLSAWVLDEHQRILPIGAVGELYIGGAGLARGYLNRPELTAERFISNPFSNDTGSRLYRTGDLVRYLPDGNLEFIGRVDHQVKVRGFRIELGEIEASLLDVSDVSDVVVVAREGQADSSDKQLVAYIVAEGSYVEDEAAKQDFIGSLRSTLQQRLPDYMIPSAFVVLDSFPLTTNGKLDRQALPAPGDMDVQRSIYVAPRTEIEAKLCTLWQEVLKLERVGVHDNFFELGG